MLTGENGLLRKAKEAQEASRKGYYQDEINLIIEEKQIEKLTNINETRTLIELIAEEIQKRDWVKTVTICDDDENEITEISQGTKILVETTDNYIIIVDISNEPILVDIFGNESDKNKKYTLKFDANGGEGILPEEITKRYGIKSILPGGEALKKQDYKVVGWSENPLEDVQSGTYYKPGDYFVLTKNTTLYAIWALNTVEISFNNNFSGTGTMQSMNVISGKPTNLISNQFTRDGYRFKEWNTSPNGDGISYGDGTQITITQDIVLYAIWQKIIILTSLSPTSYDLKLGETKKIQAIGNEGEIEATKIIWSSDNTRNCYC